MRLKWTQYHAAELKFNTFFDYLTFVNHCKERMN